MAEGKIIQIIGPVIDCEFAEHEVPLIKTEVKIQAEDRIVSAEVMQQRGEGVARCVSFEATEGLARGMKAISTGAPVLVPALVRMCRNLPLRSSVSRRTQRNQARFCLRTRWLTTW